MLKNTGVMCILEVADNNNEDGVRFVDMGNYYQANDGDKFLITSYDLAKKYGHLVKEKIYIPKRRISNT